MEYRKLDFEDVFLLTPRIFGDDRGFFTETFRLSHFSENVGDFPLVQDNHSYSRSIGTVRGLHFQTDPMAQGKLVRCISGAILDVIVDIRPGSANFGKHLTVELNSESCQQVWVPPGYAHGFCTLMPDTIVNYRVSEYYSGAHDAGIAWDDPDLQIKWPVSGDAAVLSDKDKIHPRLSERDWSQTAN